LGQYIQFTNGCIWVRSTSPISTNDRALDGYRRHVWGFTRDLVVEQTDAILLLWYMELAGRNIEAASWKAIAPHVKRGAFEDVFPFVVRKNLTTVRFAAKRFLANLCEAPDSLIASFNSLISREISLLFKNNSLLQTVGNFGKKPWRLLRFLASWNPNYA